MGKVVSTASKRSTGGRLRGKVLRPIRRKNGSGWRDYAILLGGAVLLAIVVKTFFIQAFRVPSRSMEDSLLAGDYLLVDKFGYGPRVPATEWDLPALAPLEAGDVVLFRYPLDTERIYVKRCVATAGQTVEIRNKVLYVDGRRSPDPPYSKFLDARIFPASQNRRDNLGPLVVPEGHLFVLGDNRDNSRDSRHWGLLPSHMVVGRAFGVYWSCEPAPRPSSALAVSGGNVPNAFSRVRWERLGEWVH